MKNIKAIAVCCAATIFVGLSAHAKGQSLIDSSGVASVDVQVGLSITKVADPSWGKVVAPTSGTARYQLDYATGAVTVLSGLGYAFDNGQYGEYTVSGAVGAPISYTVAIGAFSGSGVSVVASHINGAADTGTGTIGLDGNYTLKVGGVLDIAAAATIEVQTATVTVTVDYQ